MLHTNHQELVTAVDNRLNRLHALNQRLVEIGGPRESLVNAFDEVEQDISLLLGGQACQVRSTTITEHSIFDRWAHQNSGIRLGFGRGISRNLSSPVGHIGARLRFERIGKPVLPYLGAYFYVSPEDVLAIEPLYPIDC